MKKLTPLFNYLNAIFAYENQKMDKVKNKYALLQFIMRFALNTYYGIRQWLLQFMLFGIACEVAEMLGCYLSFGKFGIEGLIITICTLLYSILYYWFKTFVPRLRPLLQILIPYIVYAVIVYLEIVSINDWNFKKVTIDSYMLFGWSIPLYSLVFICFEYAVKMKLPDKPKRIIKIVWNVLTIILATVIAIGAIGFHLMLKA